MQKKAFLGLTLALFALSSNAVAACLSPEVGMASHAASLPLSTSVIVAAHGWNGACSTTFSKGRGSMLKVMQSQYGYDIDCFDYDSRKGTLAEARECLSKRLQALHDDGYRKLAFITHSTGGIVALDTILHAGLARDDTGRLIDDILFDPDNGLKLVGVYAWAAPMNGVRKPIETGGAALGVWNWLKRESERTLPDLYNDSNYLKTLKVRLARYDNLFANGGTNLRLGFRLNFLHGGDKDWVVNAVSPENVWWPKSLRTRLVATELAHLDNVGQKPRQEAPTFPAEFQSLQTRLDMRLAPRFSPYFDNGALAIASYKSARLKIADGVTSYAGNPNLFAAAEKPLSQLISRIVRGKYCRSGADDEIIVDKIIGLIEQWAADADIEDVLPLSNRLLEAIRINLSRRDDGVLCGLGIGNVAPLRVLVCRMQDAFIGVQTRAQKKMSNGATAQFKSDLDIFQNNTLTIVGNMLERVQENSSARECTRRVVDTAVQVSAPQVLRTSGIVPNFEKFLRGRGVYMPDEERARYGDTLAALGQRPEFTADIAQILGSDVGRNRLPNSPLYAVYFNEQQTRNYTAQLTPDAFAKPSVQSLVGDIIARGGPRGTSSETARQAAANWARAQRDAPALQKQDVERLIRDSIARGAYPNLGVSPRLIFEPPIR
ncbi:MAG: hypothetical protein AAF764_07220 [Pseudomonadota bacterium]